MSAITLTTVSLRSPDAIRIARKAALWFESKTQAPLPGYFRTPGRNEEKVKGDVIEITTVGIFLKPCDRLILYAWIAIRANAAGLTWSLMVREDWFGIPKFKEHSHFGIADSDDRLRDIGPTELLVQNAARTAKKLVERASGDDQYRNRLFSHRVLQQAKEIVAYAMELWDESLNEKGEPPLQAEGKESSSPLPAQISSSHAGVTDKVARRYFVENEKSINVVRKTKGFIVVCYTFAALILTFWSALIAGFAIAVLAKNGSGPVETESIQACVAIAGFLALIVCLYANKLIRRRSDFDFKNSSAEDLYKKLDGSLLTATLVAGIASLGVGPFFAFSLIALIIQYLRHSKNLNASSEITADSSQELTANEMIAPEFDSVAEPQALRVRD